MSGQLEQILDTLVTYLPVLILLIGINIFVLWRRYQSRQELLRRVSELEALSQAGRAIVAAQLDFDALCALIVEEAQKVIETRTFQLGFFEGDFYRIKVLLVQGEKQEEQVLDLREGRGLVRWVRDNKCPLLIRDFIREEATLPIEPIYLDDRNDDASILLIPLIHGQEVIGVLAAHSDRPYQFNEQHERRLTILANQAAAAVANARLFNAERRRAAQIELIGEITRQINAIEDVDELFSHVVQLTRDTFDYYQVNIYGIYQPKNLVVILASSDPRLAFGCAQFEQGEGMIGAVLDRGETLVANNVREEPLFISKVGNAIVDETWAAVEAAQVLPLNIGGVRWGVLEVLHDRIGAFTAQEAEVLETLASSISLAIQKGQQVARQLEQSWLTAARLQVAETISRSDGLESMVSNMVCLIPVLTGVERCGVLIWEAEDESYLPGGLYGMPPRATERFMAGRWRIGDWGALDAVHVGRTGYQSQNSPPWLVGREGAEFDGLTYLPLLSDARLVGVLFTSPLQHLPIRSGRMLLDDPDGRRQELLQTMAGQMAVAVERQQLRTAQEEEAWVNTALLQVADAVNSLIDLNEILTTIVRLVPLLVGVESCLILVWDEEAQTFRPGASYGVSTMGHGLLATLELTREEILEMAQEQPPREMHPVDMEHYALRLPAWLQQTLNAPQGFAIPLRSQGRLVGYMVVGRNREREAGKRPFHGRRLNILFGIAQQAATAVINHQLYQEAAERDRLEQELEVARKLQSSLLPRQVPKVPGCQLAHHWQSARQVSGDFYDYVPLRDGSFAVVVADVADKGIPAALYMAVVRTIVRAVASSRVDPAGILERTNLLLINNTGNDQFVTIFLGIWDAKSSRLRYASGGHNPAVLIPCEGDRQELQAPGMILGVFPTATYETAEIPLENGDIVIFYTDGVTEAVNSNYDEFGVERLALAAAAARHHHPSAIIKGISRALDEHVDHMVQSDDITMVVMKIY